MKNYKLKTRGGLPPYWVKDESRENPAVLVVACVLFFSIMFITLLLGA